MRKPQLIVFLLWFAFLPFHFVNAENAFNTTEQPLEVQRVVPSGEDVPVARQLVIQFNQPVVPLGRMGQAENLPITLRPELACQWRWLNRSALSCQLAEANAMLPATEYTIEIRPGIHTEAGKTLKSPYRYSFTTERPRIVETTFVSWLAPGVPLIRVHFTQPVSQQSVARSFHFKNAGSPPVSVMVQWPPIDSNAPDQLIDSSGCGSSFYGNNCEYRQDWEILPATALPLNVHVELNIEPGIKPLQGEKLGDEHRSAIAFDTFPEFQFLGVECRTHKGERLEIGPGESQPKRCNPRQGVSLKFSTPVAPDVLKKYLRLTPDLSKGRQDYDPWENHGEYSYLSQPYEKGQVYRVYLPEYL
ncbi:MAG TPA: large extracellular alpha-helical protein, partial [Gammaproteobacteria bacterium]|nr:large extracellular alpha-helical protein [Gammaproteobacteria bacterium]